MLKRFLCLFLSAMAGLCVTAVRAEVPPPPACEQLQLLLAPQPGFTEAAGQQLLDPLARLSGLQLQVQKTGEGQPADFAFGVQDLWLPASLEVLRDTGAHPLQPPLWQDEYWLWFRAGELTTLDQWPQLSGLRGGYWSQQLEQGRLTALAVHVGLDNLRLQSGPEAARRALLAGEIDFFLAAEDEAVAAVTAEAVADNLERLAVPLLVRPYWLALSNNSACKDEGVVRQLEAALAALAAE